MKKMLITTVSVISDGKEKMHLHYSNLQMLILWARIFFVDKFNASGGHNDILDGLGLPICFLYRHFTELHLKFLIRKFGCSTDSDYKELVEKGHDLIKLWEV